MEITDPKLKEQIDAWKAQNNRGSKLERRYVAIETRMNFEDQKNPKIQGHAAVFNARAEIFPGFFEEVAPGAFRDAIGSKDIYALFNHDPNNVLGNTGAQTLMLKEDERGLAYEIIPPDTNLGRDVTTLVKRGDIRKSSFGFNIEEEKFTKLDGGKVLRTILKVSPLYDVSPVTFPAYKQTDVHVRMIAGENEIAYLFEDSGQVIVRSLEEATPSVPDVQPATDEELFRQCDELLSKAFRK